MSCRTLQGKYAEKLEQRIDKAIEYIKTKDLLNERNFMETGIDLLFKELLEILEGKENE